jgi:hypothetical protein
MLPNNKTVTPHGTTAEVSRSQPRKLVEGGTVDVLENMASDGSDRETVP